MPFPLPSYAPHELYFSRHRGGLSGLGATAPLERPVGRVVSLSLSMTYQQVLDYARAGWWAMQPYATAGVPDSVQKLVADAIGQYYNAAKMIEQNKGTMLVVASGVGACSNADATAAKAISAFRFYGATPTAPAPVKAAVAALPPPTVTPNAQTLHAAQAGFFGNLGTPGKILLGVGLVWGASKLFGKKRR